MTEIIKARLGLSIGDPASPERAEHARRTRQDHAQEIGSNRHLRGLIRRAVVEQAFWRDRWARYESSPTQLKIALAGALESTEAWRERAAEAEARWIKWRSEKFPKDPPVIKVPPEGLARG